MGGSRSGLVCRNGLIAHCKKIYNLFQNSSLSIPSLIMMPCEYKFLVLDDAMNVVAEVSTSIMAAAGHQRRFEALLEDVEACHKDLILLTEIRWIRKGKVLTRFLNLMDE